ncbi:TlpA family protein disulfide reductase [Ectothiorhodospira haloalkaliphila]|uniref:TlpA family protein disulfide reductase n=1 Tax=Ectothiorhodospira haloalkaliphila TaxID=421628 RepID=UPI001EE79881|nr:TlpA disulfide reductase family protein [Ectothiorhodospira haloalkaliphila]MCG5524423.1 TlpA family protein disulfide reductase [Ectothiorhodospira haloalkaliphila]
MTPRHLLSPFLALALMTGGLTFTAASLAPTTAHADSNLTGAGMQGQQRPDFTLHDLEGEPRHISEWDDRVVLLNFWATWCPPCVREMPLFVDMQEEYEEQGLTIVAVAIDEHQAVSDFLDTYGVNFPVLIGEDDAMDVASEYGNRFGSLPYSVLLDRDGKVRYIHAGELKRDTLEREMKPLL